MAARLTPNQRAKLVQLGRRCGRSRLLNEPELQHMVALTWSDSRELGGPATLAHLVAKGYAERKMERGSRGGVHYFYRPSAAGWATFKRIDAIHRRIADVNNELDDDAWTEDRENA